MGVRLPTEVFDELGRLERHYAIDPVELDRGANGYVFFARNRITGRDVAIKFYAVEPDGLQHREPQLLAQIRSPNVLEVQDARRAGDEWAFFITPRCDGGDLDDLISKGISAGAALDVVAGICQGVSAIHAQGLVHRDLKPGNIVMDLGRPKVADFGSVRLLPEGSNAVPASQHSLLHRAPESFTLGVHGKLSDLYQIGVIAYQLLGGSLPYDLLLYLNQHERRELARLDDSFDQVKAVDAAVQKRITSGQLLRMESLPPWTRPVHRVIRRMTATDPTARYRSISAAATALHANRTKVVDWQRTSSGAVLLEARRRIEVRETNTPGLYEAFVDNGSGYRRARVGKGTLAAVIDSLK